MALHLTNTLSGKKELFKPLGDTVKIYICGMTVQGPPHFGHMRAYITADILLRYLEFYGYKLKVVQNFTDIDDKVIEKSLEEKIDYRIIAEKNIQEYYEVADKMGIRRADVYPEATKHIQEITLLIQKLIDKKYAYVAGGDVYFEVDKFSEYGKLSKKKLDDLIAGARVEVREQKKNPADFALWKSSKPGEPWWESPWGRGRPGWAIECSAMSMHYLGETLDLHLGGEDLIFPHHENEIAQSEAATGKPFVRYWIHNAMLNLTGKKMSKSTKHFITAKEILEKRTPTGEIMYTPNVIRLYFLQSHYRSPQEFDYKILDSAKESWARIEEFLFSSEKKGVLEDPDIISDKFKTVIKELMNDDLNTPDVLSLLFDKATEGFEYIQKFDSMQSDIRDIITVLYSEVIFILNKLGFKTSVSTNTLEYETKHIPLSSNIIIHDESDAAFFEIKTRELIKARNIAREKKEFEIADLIRKWFDSMNYSLIDSENITSIKRIDEIKYNYFISYETRTGLEYAKHLKKALEQKGFSVFLADETIKAGDEWQKTIKSAIQHCECFIVIITALTMDSSWVMDKYKTAVRFKRHILPCRYSKIDLEETEELISLQQVVFDNSTDLANKVLIELKNIIKHDRSVRDVEYDGMELLRRGNLLLSTGTYYESIALFDKALSINPNYAEALVAKGNAHVKLKDNKSALELFLKATEIKPNYVYAWLCIGGVYLRTMRYKEALVACEKTIEIKPDYHLAWNGKGSALFHLKKYQEALEAYNEAIRLSPKYFWPWVGKGNVYYEYGKTDSNKYDDAIIAYKKVIEIKPDFPGAWWRLARIYALIGDKENMLFNLKKATDLDSKLKAEAKITNDFKNYWMTPILKKL